MPSDAPNDGDQPAYKYSVDGGLGRWATSRKDVAKARTA